MLDEGALLSNLGADGAALALLVCGHVLGDFVFQTKEMVRRKIEFRWLLFHVLVLSVVQAAVILPFYPALGTVLAVVVVGILHLMIDYARTNFEHRLGMRPGWDIRLLLADQSLHVTTLIGAWYLFLNPVPLQLLSPALIDVSATTLTQAAVLLAGVAFLWNGGSAVVRGTLDVVLHRSGGNGLQTMQRAAGEDGEEDETERDRVGELIGKLERELILVLGLIDAWAVIGLYVGTKPFARLRMGGSDQPGRSEEDELSRNYYLVGTLASVLVAILAIILVRLLV